MSNGIRNREGDLGVEARQLGFSLLELLVSVAVFLVISAAAFSLFIQQQTTSEVVQGQAGLNIALRNAVAQLEIDLANAGSGYFQGVNIPSWPVGVTIVNHVVPSTSSCYTASTYTYGANCFDQINIIAAADPTNYPPINATDSTGGTSLGNCSHSDSGTAYGQPASGLTAAQTAAKFHSGDQLLLLNNTGSKITSVVLTANASVAGSVVEFDFNPTSVQTVSGVTYRGYNSLSNDPLDITACDGNTPCTPAAQPNGNLGDQFCGGDWILKLAPIVYQVDTSVSSNPKLTRTANGATEVVMEHVIGFKVGAAIWNDPNDDFNTTSYNYDSSTYTNQTANDVAYNFTLVRSVRVSLVGRTAPNLDPNYKFRNSFDGGPYQVQGTAIVVNPRNLSMND